MATDTMTVPISARLPFSGGTDTVFGGRINLGGHAMPADATPSVIAHVAPDGQVVLPKEVCEMLGVVSGGRVALFWKDNQAVMMNPLLYALDVLHERMQGKFEEAGLHTDEDVMELVKEIRDEIEGIPLDTATKVTDTVPQTAI